MNTSMNAVEAARWSRYSEKTIHTWIKSGELPSQREGREHVIKQRDLERVVRAHSHGGSLGSAYATPRIPSSQDPDRIAALEAEVADLKRWRESHVAEHHQVSDSALNANLGQQQRHVASPNKHVQSTIHKIYHDIPSDWVLVSSFAERHGRAGQAEVARARLGKIVSTEADTASRPGSIGRWLTPKQQYDAVQNWIRRDLKYTPCPDCPHETVYLERDRDANATRPMEKPPLDE